MKTIEQVKQIIESLSKDAMVEKEHFNSGIDSVKKAAKRNYKKIASRISFNREVLMFLELNPSEDSIQKSLDKQKYLLSRLQQQAEAKYPDRGDKLAFLIKRKRTDFVKKTEETK